MHAGLLMLGGLVTAAVPVLVVLRQLPVVSQRPSPAVPVHFHTPTAPAAHGFVATAPANGDHASCAVNAQTMAPASNSAARRADRLPSMWVSWGTAEDVPAHEPTERS